MEPNQANTLIISQLLYRLDKEYVKYRGELIDQLEKQDIDVSDLEEQGLLLIENMEDTLSNHIECLHDNSQWQFQKVPVDI